MKVFVAGGGYDYEGSDLSSVQVFSDESAAEEYGEALIGAGYDWFKVVERDVQ